MERGEGQLYYDMLMIRRFRWKSCHSVSRLHQVAHAKLRAWQWTDGIHVCNIVVLWRQEADTVALGFEGHNFV